MAMSKRAKTVTGRLSLLIVTLIWGSSFVVLKNTLESVTTLYVLAFRFTGAAALMLLIGFPKMKKLNADYWKGGALMGLALFCAYVFQTFGLVHTTPGVNAFLTATYCILVPFINWGLRKKRPGTRRLVAAVICITGVGLVSVQEDLRIGLGEGLTLCCGLFYALHILVTNAYVKGRDPLPLTMVQFLTVAVLCWISALTFEPVPSDIPAETVWALAYLCVMCTGVCFLLQTVGQKYTPPSETAVIMTLESVFGVIISVLFGERPTERMYLGFVLIFVAILLSEWQPGTRHKTETGAAENG